MHAICGLMGQIVLMNRYSLGQLAIGLVMIAAIVALVYVALGRFGIQIPSWVQQVFWILIVAFVVIVAIKLVLSM